MALDPVMFRQLPVIQQIIRDETWYEGERRGCAVPAGDPVVRERVCTIILRIGAGLRASLEGQIAAYPPPVQLPLTRHDREHAA
ncbi:MAG: hypothetical protein PSV13_10885 [Lacunisphaera sp.]|nr:hypothetical protein [Lacunisphaera sp.]